MLKYFFMEFKLILNIVTIYYALLSQDFYNFFIHELLKNNTLPNNVNLIINY